MVDQAAAGSWEMQADVSVGWHEDTCTSELRRLREQGSGRSLFHYGSGCADRCRGEVGRLERRPRCFVSAVSPFRSDTVLYCY